MWGWGLVLSMVVTTREQLEGEHQTKNLTLFFLAYGPYMFIPIVIMLRVASTPVFSINKKKPE